MRNCAENGVIMENWPEGIVFPCDSTKSRGISGLSAKELRILLAAFRGSDPIRFKKISDDRKFSFLHHIRICAFMGGQLFPILIQLLLELPPAVCLHTHMAVENFSTKR